MGEWGFFPNPLLPVLFVPSFCLNPAAGLWSLSFALDCAVDSLAKMGFRKTRTVLLVRPFPMTRSWDHPSSTPQPS